MKQVSITIILLLTYFVNASSQRAKDGNKIINTGTSIINEYTSITADALAGDSILSVQSSSLNTNGRFATTLSPGDLLMIIQMQGASLNGFYTVGLNNTRFGHPKDSTWGNIISYNNCGNYQLVQVKSVINSTTIKLDCNLMYDFTDTGKVQLVRIPRYNNLTVNSAGTISCDAWNGTKGGIIAFEVEGTTTINGTISADAKGFRGGSKENHSTLGLNEIACDTADVGAEKGEGIGGYKSSYNYLGGRFCKGAPANAGGGGDCHNAGGGGGGNGGDISIYHGVGVPDISNANYITAFNLETPGFANVISSGGGRGGYSASSSNVSPLTNAPGTSAWNGDFRIKNGGFGGRPLDYNLGKIFLGGGGGAGDMNENYGGRGGNAGGLIYAVCYGAIAGAGIIRSNGENGENTTATSAPPFGGTSGQDGAGGAGAGGTIVIRNYSGLGSISCQAKGGNGGVQTLYNNFSTVNQAQGPGGGGGGGYICTASTPLSTNILGGTNGTTNSNAMISFPCNGATKGAVGTVATFSNLPNILAADDTICPGTSTTLQAHVVNNTDTILNWYDAPIGGNLLYTGNSFTTPILNTNTDYYITACPFPFRKKVTVTMLTAATVNISAGSDQQVCITASVSLHGNNSLATANCLWTSTNTSINISNPNDTNAIASNLVLGDNTFIWTVVAGCITNADTVIITVNNPPNANAGIDQHLCSNNTTLNATVSNSGSWSVLSGSGNVTNSNFANTLVNNLSIGSNEFIWSIPSQNNCPTSYDTVLILVDEPPSVANAGSNQTTCTNSVLLNATPPTIGVGSWTVFSGSANLSNALASSTMVNNLSIGINQFIFSVANGICISNLDTITITLNQNLSQAYAGTDVIQCGSSIVLNAAQPNVGNGTWTSPNTNVSIVSPTIANTTILNLTNAQIEFIWTVSGNNCVPNSDTVLVTNYLQPSTAVAGNDTNTCNNSITLNATQAIIGNGLWSPLGNTSSIFNSTSANPIISNLQIGDNLFLYTISNGICVASTDTVLVHVNQIISANAGVNKTICTDTTSLLATPTNGTGSWTSTSTSVITDSNSNATTVSNLQMGINNFVWQVSSNSCPTIYDTIQIFRSTPVSTASAGDYQTLCKTQTTLQAQQPTSGNGIWSIVSGGGSFTDIHSSISSVSNLHLGVNTFKWTVSKPGCSSSFDNVIIEVFETDSTAKVMNDTTITPSTPTTLHAYGGSSYLWEPSIDLSCNTCPNPIFTGNADFSYIVTITDNNSCVVIDTLNIKTSITKFVEVADVFSPNASDERNKVLRLHHSGLSSVTFEVYDEWGEKVFYIGDKESFDKTWDGSFKGEKVSSGTFYYLIAARYLDNSSEMKKGKILLMR